MPGSATTPTTCPRPSRASSRSPARAATWRSRPTRGETRRLGSSSADRRSPRPVARKTSTGSSRPRTGTEPAGSTATYPRTACSVAPPMRTAPGAARASRRAATFTVSPMAVRSASLPVPSCPTTTAPVADPDAHPHERVAALGPLPRDALLQGQRGEHRPQGVVLARQGGADQGQEAVAQVLVDRAAEAGHLLLGDLEEAIEQLVHGFLADPLRHGGGADHVAEDRGEDAALAGLLALTGEPRAALLAEALPGGDRCAAARASRVVRAEFRASHGPRLPGPPGNGDDRRAQAVWRPSITSRRCSRPAVITPASRDSMS